ncbi:hypothetical protein PIB30_010585 [Stylosanthes scabra]|uniref:GATA transcription factor n=1 Tax=Stylosanthes scabra TaxID=79078 RepID=A0ABU6S5V8_9FABA|nr:hypothetical protein [Stylosanthes scabra]
MEVVVAKAFKPSLRTDLIFHPPLPLAADKFLCFNNAAALADDFSVDDLLDFSEQEHQEKDNISATSSQDPTENDTNSNSSTAALHSHSIFAAEFSVPDDDLAELEWVSRFVDDSVPERSLLYPVPSELTRAQAQPQPKPASSLTSLPTGVPVKPRTTKTRKPNARLLRPFISTLLSPAKKQKRKPEDQACGFQFQRRCSHCQVQKTPQWRAGPMGPKTLCNACGVRYKLGRLFPEYRPACSPTFSGDIHSNSHRKVLEMRRRKEMSRPEPGPERAHMFPSC